MADEPRFIGDPVPEPPPAADPKAARKPTGPRFKQDDAAGSRRATAIVVGLFLLAILAGVLVALPLFLSTPPRPRLLTVHVERYDSPGWGVAAWADRDAAALVAAFREPDAGRSADADRNLLQSDKLRARLAGVQSELAAPGTGKRPFVLSVSGLAAVRADGTPCLLPTDGDPFDSAKWLPLDEVLAALKCEPPVPRLLLLDLARPTADPFLGRPAETASAAVCELLRKRQADGSLPCAVLTAAAPGEVSLPAPRAKLSAFGLYLSDGLQGAAAGDGGKADEVTAGGLARFVAHRVERFARAAHDRPQHPQLFTPAGNWDFVLVTRVTPTAPTLTAEPVKPEEYAYPAPLRAAWKRWDGLLAANADREEPEGFARLTGSLLRAERLWLGTDDAAYAGGVCDLAFIAWDEARRASRPPGQPADDGAAMRAAGRWRLAARDGPPPSPELQSALAKYLTARLLPGAKPEVWAAAQQAWADKATDPVAARLVWQRLVATDPEPTRDRVQALAELLGEATVADDPPPLERLLVRYLAGRRFQTEQGLSFPAEAVTAWLRAEDVIGRVLAAGPVGFAALVRAMDDAEADRRAGVELLFAATNAAQAKAATGKLAAAADGFARVATAGGGVPKLVAVAGPLLRAVLAQQPGASASGGEWFDRWQEAVRLLDAVLSGRPLDPAATAKLADEATAAIKRLAEQMAPARVEEWEKRPAPWGKVEAVRAATALVAGPGLPADGRAKVWELVRREWWAKHDDVRKLDAADVDNRTPPPAFAPPPAVDADPADRRRAEAATALLRLAVGGDASAAAWRTEVPRRAAAAVRDGDWPTANRLVRVVPPGVAVLPRPMPGTAALDKPAADDRVAYRRWVAAQLRNGYQTPVAGIPLWDKLDPDRVLRRTLATD